MMYLAKRTFLLTLTALGLLLLLGGCGGTYIDDDGGYDPGDPDYPVYKDLTLVLRVETPAGRPIGGAEVLVDGERDAQLTARQFHRLGDGYPYAWRGWLANWTSEDYQVVMNYWGDRDQFEIRVRKAGYTQDSAIVRVDDYEPDHIYIRAVMVLRKISTLGVQEAKSPGFADVLGGEALARLNDTAAPKRVILGTDDRLSPDRGSTK